MSELRKNQHNLMTDEEMLLGRSFRAAGGVLAPEGLLFDELRRSKLAPNGILAQALPWREMLLGITHRRVGRGMNSSHIRSWVFSR